MDGIEVTGLTVRFGRRLALDDVDLRAQPGRITGLVGPNGAGKSTCLAAISGEPLGQRGRISVGGRVGRPRPGTLAYLHQRADLDPNYPIQVGEVVDMGRTPLRRPWRRRSAHDRACVAEALERVGLTALAREAFGELSGGQQQRVLLARSLAQGAQYLLLDEPFVGIDAGTSRLLEQVLRERAAQGATVILVDHGLQRLAELCDELVLLDHRVLAVGPPREVLDPTLLATVFAGLEPSRPEPPPVAPDPMSPGSPWPWEAADALPGNLP